MRRLPVYLLLDTSGSMMGGPIEQVQSGVSMMLTALRSDPYALETAYLSVVEFNSSAEQIVPLTELTAFQPPKLHAMGATSLGEGLRVLAESASREVRKTTADSRGDWKPMVFIMTDGSPTDDWAKGLARFKEERWGIIVGCAVNQGDTKVLKEIAGQAVVTLDTADPAALAAFFKWVSASVSSGSQKVESGQKELSDLDELPPPPDEIKIAL